MKIKYRYFILSILLVSLWTNVARAQTAPQPNYTLTTNESGATKSYIARDYVSLKPGYHYAATSTNTFNAKIDPLLLFPPTANTYALPDGTITTDPTLGGVVGSIPGQFGVSPSGGATYSIPIECPAGINGMQPNISLVYNSQGGNGIAGWGWNISGMSAISRTGSNLYNDGKTAVPTLTSADNLTLNGQRLILVSGGINSNLIEGAVYMTENADFSYITFKTINGFLCFEVKTKEGITMEFGSSADSYIEAQGSTVPLTWLLTKVTDANGNYMTYTYGEDNTDGEFWLDKIKYTYNAAAGITTAPNEIDFIYTSGRADSQTSYIAGSKIKESHLLQAIRTFTNSQKQREYSFTYSFSDGFYNKLTTINESGSDGIKYNPTVIDWNKLNSSTTPSFGFTTNSTAVGTLTRFTMDKTMVFVDLNNDGFVDMIRPTMDILDYPVYTGWEMYYSTNNGQNFVLTQTENKDSQGNPGNFPVYVGSYQFLPADINGDGISDIVEIRNSTDPNTNISYCTIDVLLNVNGQLVRQNLWQQASFNLSGVANEKLNFELGDFNVDGNTELIIKKTSGSSKIEMYNFNLTAKTLTLLSTTSNINGDLSKSRTTDVNGNGKSEIFTTEGEFLEYNNLLNTFEEITFEHDLSFNDTYYEFADINGDGKTDVLEYYYGLQEWAVKLSTGERFENITCPLTRTKDVPTPDAESDDFYCIKDLNGDGKGDIIEVPAGSNNVNLYYYNGSGFISTIHTIYDANGFFNDRTLPYYDINGDGKSDIINTYTNGFSVISFSTPETERSVSTITNGMGIKNTVVYKLLSDSTVYTNGTSTVSQPMVKLCIPMQVASQTITSAGNLSDTTNYTYKGLRLHTKGKGMLGFEEFTQDNITQNKKSVTLFGYNTTYFNTFPTQQTVSTSTGNQLISTTTYINSIISFGGKRIFPYAALQTTTDNLTGLSSTTEATYDNYGNPRTITTTKGAGVVETKKMHYITKASWCNNKVDSVTVTQSLGSESFTRKSLYFYDDKGNLTKEIVDPTDVNSVTTEYKNYDTFGHALLCTVTANNVTRSTSSTYTTSGRFPLSKTNALGETTTYNWDQTKGQLNSETNRFGTTSYTYNGFGSLVETKLPDGIRKAQVKQWAAANNSIGAKYFDYAETSGNAPITVWYDAWGREIQKDSYGLNAKKISVTTEYYSNGQAYRVSKPYFEQDASSKTWAQTYTYDDYGRPFTLTTPMGVSTTVYSGKTTTVTTPDGTNETTVNDAGQTITSKVNGKTVTYAYYASGLTKTSTPEGGQAIEMQYNLQGKRTKLTDPDAGTIRSQYNGFGELILQKQKIHLNQDSISTVNNYATNGLLQTIVRNGETTAYTYDSNNRVSIIEISGKNKQTFTYDGFDRVTNVKEEIGTRVYNTGKEYNYFGRVKKEIYPSGYYVQNTYDSYGNLSEIKDKAGRSIWKANAENARRQLTSINKGSKETTFGFDSRGLPTSIVASGVEDMSYSFDSTGNLSYRTDNLTNQNEQFTYDGMNRLTNWDIYQNGVLAKQNGHTYDAATGNITSRSDLGNFTMNYGEGNGKPHALTSIMGKPEALPFDSLNVTYTDFKKIATLKEGNKGYKLTYGVDDQRRMSKYAVGGDTILTRYYVGNYEEEINSLGNVRKIHYLSGGAMLIQNNGTDSLLYAYSDFQGSLIALTDASGNVVEKYAYDPWGARRNPDNWTQKDTRTKWITSRGYTGHEHLDAFGIINMNGRVYDPATAMFFSPDPYVQAPDNWLNYNRYGYCMNNPFRYTDPSGYTWWSHFTGWVGGTAEKALNVVVNAVVDVAAITIGVPLAMATTAVSTILGIGQGIFNGNWTILKNDVKIVGGLFTGSPGQILSRFTWELPQTIAGYVASQGSNMIGDVKDVSYYDGATVVQHYSKKWGAFTLGSYINGSRDIEANPTNQLFQHEYGHYLQSQEAGWVYLSRYAIPSGINCLRVDKNFDSYYQHAAYGIEQDANIRAMEYFKGVKWDYKSNPIFDSGYNPDFDRNYSKYRTNEGLIHTSWWESALIMALCIEL